MDYNELNILSEFQIYNLLFAKNELQLDDERTSYFLQVFWKLLSISNTGDKLECRKAEDGLQEAIAEKFQGFKDEVVHRTRQGMFSKE